MNYFDESGFKGKSITDKVWDYCTGVGGWASSKVGSLFKKSRKFSGKAGTVFTVIGIYNFADWKGRLKDASLSRLKAALETDKYIMQRDLIYALDGEDLYTQCGGGPTLTIYTNRKGFDDFTDEEKALLVINIALWDPDFCTAYIKKEYVNGIITVVESK